MGLNQIRISTRKIALVSGLAFEAALMATESTILVRTPSSAGTKRSSAADTTEVLSVLPRPGQDAMGQVREGGSFGDKKNLTVFGHWKYRLTGQTRDFPEEHLLSESMLSKRSTWWIDAVDGSTGTLM
jgi:guanyl-specific ribonuclease Sa